jgi:hypothetical protein
LWPDLSPEEETRQREQRERAARENAAYSLLDNNQCGRAELAGKSVAVPFIGAAATLVVAEAEQRMFAKLNKPGFLAGLRPLLAATEAAQLTDGAMKAAFVKVFSRFVILLPGDPSARSAEMKERFEIVL